MALVLCARALYAVRMGMASGMKAAMYGKTRG